MTYISCYYEITKHQLIKVNFQAILLNEKERI